MLIRIISILFPLFAITVLGYLIGRRTTPDLSHANQLNMDVFTPALIFSALAGNDCRIISYLALSASVLLIIAGSGLAGWGIARLCKVRAKTLVPPLMFNNCGNLGLPIAVLTFGPRALMPAVVMFVVSNILHFSFGAWLLDHHSRLSRVLRSPSVLAALSGLLVGSLGWHLWPPLLIAVKMLGDISIPLMLFALGARLANSHIRSVGFGLWGGALRPMLGMGLAWLAMHLLVLPPEQRALLLVFGALPPAVLNYMFAERYQQEPDKVASVVLIGNLESLLFLPLALWLSL